MSDQEASSRRPAQASRSGADLQRRDFSGVDLSGACLRLADLSDAVLRGADLRGADLRGSYLVTADLRGARTDQETRFDGALFSGAKGPWQRARSRLLLVLGNLHRASGDAVLDALDGASLDVPGWSWHWEFVGTTLADIGREGVALDVLITAAAEHPTPDVRRALADLLLQRGSLAAAAAILRPLQRRFSRDPAIAARLGYVLGRLGEVEEAHEHLERAVSLGQDDANTWSALGMTAFLQRDTATARTALERAAAGGDPRHVENLARFQVAQDDLVSAAETLASLDPTEATELRAHLAPRLSGEMPPARVAASPAPRPTVAGPAEMPLPIRQDALAEFCAQHPDLGPFPEHVIFASPHAIGLVMPSGSDFRVVWHSLGSGSEPVLTLGQALPAGLQAPENVTSATLSLLTTLPPGSGSLPSLFDQRDVLTELLRLYPGRMPRVLQRRLRSLPKHLATRYALQPAHLEGASTVLDALVPDVILLDADGSPTTIQPPHATRRGPASWMQAQAVAWLGFDKHRFLHGGTLHATPELQGLLDAFAGADAATGRQLVGMAGVVWLRWFLGLARLWPDRRGRFLSRFLEVLHAVEGGLPPDPR